MEPTLCVLVNCSPAWSCPQVFRSGLRMRLGEGRFGLWQGVVFLQSFWNFKAIPDTEIILTSIQSKLILKKFKWFLWRVFQMWWKLLFRFWWKCEEHEVTSGWSQKVEISIWGLLRTVFKAFILFAWLMILFRMREHCLPIQIVCLWSERAWLGT